LANKWRFTIATENLFQGLTEEDKTAIVSQEAVPVLHLEGTDRRLRLQAIRNHSELVSNLALHQFATGWSGLSSCHNRRSIIWRGGQFLIHFQQTTFGFTMLRKGHERRFHSRKKQKHK
jgi:hypothetical protein